MAITLEDLKQKTLTAVTRTLEHKSGVDIVIEYDGDKSFERAYTRLQEMNAEERTAAAETRLSKEYNEKNQMTSVERQLFVMGEFLIKSWDGVIDPDGNPIPVNGQNLVKLIAYISDDELEQVQFMTDLFELIGEVTQEFADKNNLNKKKPSKSTPTASKKKS